MPVSSLSRMTVPLANDQSNPNQGLLMPKLRYRFRVLFENFGVGASPTTELTKQVVDFTRPSLSFEEIQVDVYNSKLYLAGRHTWEMVTVNVRDDASGEVQRLVGTQLQKQFDFFNQASSSSGSNYKFVTKCQILDGGNGLAAPTVLETWDLYGCFLQSANYNELGYGSNEAVTVTMQIRFDNALQTTNGSVGPGVGQNVPAIFDARGEVTGVSPI